MSDVAIFSPMFRGMNPSSRTVSKSSVIFCCGDKAEDFLSDYGRSITAKVLIFGNSDRDFYDFNYKLPNSVKVVFAQNLIFKDPRFKCLPIGLENVRLAWNGFPDLLQAKANGEGKSDEILIGPFGKTHKEREDLMVFRDLQGPWTFTTARLHPKEYAELASRFRFIAAPRGNGVDTHRFWETLYRGSIPIIVKSAWSENLEYLGIPFVGLDDWSPESVLNGIKEFVDQEIGPQNIADLWWPSWRRRISSYL
jgi:hypothetical protein